MKGHTHIKSMVSNDYYSDCVLSNLGHSNNLAEARNEVISKNERGIFDIYQDFQNYTYSIRYQFSPLFYKVKPNNL